MLSDIKAAYDLGKEGVKAIQSIRKKVEKTNPIYDDLEKVYAIISEMKDHINDAKDKYFEVSVENEKLKKELSKEKNWEVEKNNFSLEEITPGCFAYVSNDDPRQKFCEVCFLKEEKSHLLMEKPNSSFTFYTCRNCKAKITVDHRRPLTF